MYQIGDSVIYGAQGVCTVVNIEEKMIGTTAAQYYVLRPFFQDSSTIFIPKDNQTLTAKLHAVLSKDQLETCILHAGDTKEPWDSNDQSRQAHYSDVLRGSDRNAWFDMLRALTGERRQRMRAKKRLGMTDERQMKDVEKLIHDEVAYVLGLERDDVPKYIAEHQLVCAETM